MPNPTVQLSKIAYDMLVKQRDEFAAENSQLKKGMPTSTPGDNAIIEENSALKAELEQLKAALAARPVVVKERKTGMKVSEKGAVSVYGLGRFPFTQYKDNMLKILDMADVITQFIADHDSELSVKEDK